MKYKVTAVIPTMQYGNIQPSIEVEAETFEEAQAQVMPYIEKVWAEYGEKPLNKQAAPTLNVLERKKDYFGNEIDYDEANHIYSWRGEVYLSGSQYAKKFEKPFEGAAIAAKMATKYGVEPADIVKMWELKARTSREFGVALHSALELYGRYDGLAKSLERDTAMHDHPVIKHAVQSFYADRNTEKAEYEVLIVDHQNKRAGQIDRLLLDDGEYQVQDFKCNAVMDKAKLAIYWKQLDFYTEILNVNGLKTRPPTIFHYDGNWKAYNKGDS